MYDFIVNKSSKQSYRQTDCFELCIQQRIIESCSCFHTAYDSLGTKLRPCLNETDFECLNQQISSFKVDQCKECPLECESISYDISQSSLDAPSEAAFNDLFLTQNYRDLFKSYNLNLTHDTFRASSISFNVYYANQQYNLISETPKMTIFDLFTQIGGSVGMFVSSNVGTLLQWLRYGTISASIIG